MERLHRALHPQVAALATVCEKLGNIFDNTLQQSLELQAECDPDSLWDSKYHGQPCIGEMLEWLEDCFIAAGREHALSELLMCEVGSEEGMHRTLDLWESWSRKSGLTMSQYALASTSFGFTALDPTGSRE